MKRFLLIALAMFPMAAFAQTQPTPQPPQPTDGERAIAYAAMVDDRNQTEATLRSQVVMLVDQIGYLRAQMAALNTQLEAARAQVKELPSAATAPTAPSAPKP